MYEYMRDSFYIHVDSIIRGKTWNYYSFSISWLSILSFLLRKILTNSRVHKTFINLKNMFFTNYVVKSRVKENFYNVKSSEKEKSESYAVCHLEV